MSPSLSYNIAKANPVELHCWAIPNPKTVPTYTLSCYIPQPYQTFDSADVYPAFLFC